MITLTKKPNVLKTPEASLRLIHESVHGQTVTVPVVRAGARLMATTDRVVVPKRRMQVPGSICAVASSF